LPSTHIVTAPEHKFPAGINDCTAVVKAVLDDTAAFEACDDAIVGIGGAR
jgi:acetyl esterase/lipase